MCIVCKQRLLAAINMLSTLVSHSSQTIQQLEAALADKMQDSGTAVAAACTATRVLLRLTARQARKLVDQELDLEAMIMCLSLRFITTGLAALFAQCCAKTEHKRLLRALLQIDSIESACAATLSALIHCYRAGEYCELPAVVVKVRGERLASLSSGG